MGTHSPSGWVIATMNKYALFVLAALLVVESVQSVTIEWTVPMTPVSLCVAPGTEVIFQWSGGHNVEEVSSAEEWDECVGFNNLEAYEGPQTWTAPNKTGSYYLVCGVGQHCAWGKQKAIINVQKTC